MQQLPRSARLVCWFNASCAGAVAIDDLVEAVTGEDTAHSVLGFPDGSALTLLQAVGALRRAGASAATLALPAPGDPVGIGGPRAFSEAAVEAGEAAVFPGARLGLVPSVVGSGVFWQAYPAAPAVTVTDVPGAERSLREALVSAAQDLDELAPAQWRAEVGDALATLRTSRAPMLPDGYSARADRLAALAMRCAVIVELAPERARALVDLERAARHALVAAASETPQHRADAGR